MTDANPSTRLLLRLIDQAYDHHAWHGTNLRGSLRGLTLAQLVWRPRRGRHNIWEIAVHCAYWKYAVKRKLMGEGIGSFPLKGNNWFDRPVQRTTAAWKADLAILRRMHEDLLEATSHLSPSALNKRTRSGRYSYADLIAGAASHDLYHAGQIQLIKRLFET